MLEFPVGAQSVGFRNFCGRHLALDIADILWDAGQEIPHQGLNVVLLYAFTQLIEQTEIVASLSCSA